MIAFLITPVLVHALGDHGYGLWVVVFSITGYFGLVDQGIRPSLVRYVSRDRASGDAEGLSATLSSALGLYSVAGLVTLIASAVLAANFGAWFKVEPDQLHTASTAVFVAGLALALGFPFGVFGAALSGLQRYDLANLIGIGIGVLRALLFLLVLRMGGGVVELAWASLSANLLGHVLSWIAVRRLLPDVRLGVKRVTRERLALIGSYSGFAFLGAVASSIAFQTDSLVITAFLGAALVTPFALAAGLIENVRSLIYAATYVLAPTASEMHTMGEKQKLHAMLITGCRYSVLLCWPVLLGLMIFGEGFLVTWVGESYATRSSWSELLSATRQWVAGAGAAFPHVSPWQILCLLAAPSLISLPQSTASSVLFGISRHRGIVGLAVVNAVLNLLLSLWWVVPMGLFGVALGTAVPQLLVGVATAVYAARALGLSVRRYLWEGMASPGLACLVFAIPAWAIETMWKPRGWIELALAGGGCWVAFVIFVWMGALKSEERQHWVRSVRGLWGRAPGDVRTASGVGS